MMSGYTEHRSRPKKKLPVLIQNKITEIALITLHCNDLVSVLSVIQNSYSYSFLASLFIFQCYIFDVFCIIYTRHWELKSEQELLAQCSNTL